MKNLINFFAATILLLTLAMPSAFAQTSTWDGTTASWTQGTGTLSNPYLIESAQNLAYLAEMVNGGVDQYTGKWFKLTVDINLNNRDWIPIGDNNTTSARFAGNFDGDNHSITNLKISSSTLMYGGLFGYVINSGTFRNINIGGTISSYAAGSYCGGIVGYSDASKTFSNCHNSASVSSKSYSGGLVGSAGSNVTVTNCSNAGTIASSCYSGGLIGYGGSTVTMTDCNNSSSVSASYTASSTTDSKDCYSGGLIGYGGSTNTISNCSNSGNVTASLSNTSTGLVSSSCTWSSYTGGVFGYISNGTVTKCANTGNVSSTSATKGYGEELFLGSNKYLKTYSYSGGIAGYSNASFNSTISLCYNTGTITATANNTNSNNQDATRVSSYSGGVLGYASGTNYSIISNSYNRGNVTATSSKASSGYSNAYEYASGIGYNSQNTNCYNTGTLTAPTTACSNTYKYGIGNETTTNCYYLSTCGSNGGNGVSKTAAVMKSESFPIVLNSEVFMMDITPNVNDGYPIFGAGAYFVTKAATNVDFTSATLNGHYYVGSSVVDMLGFEYKRTSASSWTTVYTNVGTPTSYNLTGLWRGTDYQCRLFVKIGEIIIYGNTVNFTTRSCDATVSVTTENATICDNIAAELSANATSSGSISSYSWSNGNEGPSITTNVAGTYRVTITDEYNCTAFGSITISTIPAPTAGISGNTYLCTGNSTTLTASGGVGYVWSTGATTPSISVSETGEYYVIARASNDCKDTAYVNVANFNEVTISGNTSICVGESTTLSVSEANSYLWSTGATTQSIQVTEEGLYSVTATNSTCEAHTSVYVAVNALPTATISGTTAICGGASTTLTANGGTSYAWSNGANTQSIEASSAGAYTVTVTNATGCTASAVTSVVSAPNPSVQISGNLTACQGESVTLTASGGTSYNWSNSANTASINPTQSGTYIVTAYNVLGCEATASAEVIISPNPQLNITAPQTICNNGSTILSVSDNLGTTLTSCVWSNGGSGTSISVSPTATTNYTVTVTNSNGCTAQASTSVAVAEQLSLSLAGNTSICGNESATLTVSGISPSNVSTYAWSNGANTASVSVSASGTYSVIVTDVNGCTGYATTTVSAAENPVASISGQQSVCSGSSATLLASGGTSYQWSDGSTDASISVTTGGTYTVVVTNGAGCTATASAMVTVNDSPSPQISGNLSICGGESTTLSVTGGDSFVWSNGSTDASIDVASFGNYSVIASNSNGCTASASATVNVMENPTVTISGESSMCVGEATYLTAEGGVSYVWNNEFAGQGINVYDAGTYSVVATDANGCTSNASIVVTQNSLPVASISGQQSVCSGSTATLLASGGTSYLWSNGSTDASLQVTTGGTYTVVVSNGAGCTATASAMVTVNDSPVPVISGNLSICEGASTMLSVSGGDSYVWSNGSTSASINVTSSGNYSVIASNSNGCTASASTTVNVMENPTVTISGEPSICVGGITNLTADGGASYIWSNGFQGSSINVSEAGTYSVIATSANGCTSSATMEVVQYSAPEVSISGNTTVCEGNSEILTAIGGVSYVWSTGETTSAISVNAFGIYSVTATGNGGCTSTANVTVFVASAPTPVINGDLHICDGDPTTLTATGGETYMWSNGSTANSITVSNGGTYSVIATNENGCTAMASANVVAGYSVTNAITETTDNEFVWNGQTYTESGDYVQTFTAANGCDSVVTLHLTVNSVQYYNIFVISSNNAYGTTTGTGVYEANAVVPISAIANEGYEFLSWNDGNTENPRTITVTGDATYIATFIPATGIEENATLNISLFPNPATDILNITSSETISEIEIVNTLGQVVYRTEVNADNAVCDVNGLTSGVYIVRITAASASPSTTLREQLSQRVIQQKFIKE